MNKKNLFILLSFVTIFSFISCYDEYSRKISEELYFVNEATTEIYIKFDFLDKNLLNIDTVELKNPNSEFFDRFFVEDGKVKIVRLNPTNITFQYQFDESYIKDIWMSEREFNHYISQIHIYKIVNNDTLFVNPNLYNKKSKWDYHIYTDGHFFYRSTVPSAVSNRLNINDNMFDK